MEWFADYGLFLLKALTVLVVLGLLLGFILTITARQKQSESEGTLKIRKLNDEFEDQSDEFAAHLLNEGDYKARRKALEKAKKAASKTAKNQTKATEEDTETPGRVFVLNFDGDMQASESTTLAQQISAVISNSEEGDQVIVCLESPGGLVHSYGYAASQLARLKPKGLRLTVAVDKVAASGGYMMACVADEIIAAPFAVIGSIGVVAQVPNFHRLLKKNDIDVEVLTAGKYKRTLTMLGKNSDDGRQKFLAELEATHALFKKFASEHRPALNLETVATGEIWYGTEALDIGLIDRIATSDELILQLVSDHDVYKITFEHKKTLAQRLGFAAEQGIARGFERIWQTQFERWF